MTKVNTNTHTMKDGTRFDDSPSLTSKQNSFFVCDDCGLSLEETPDEEVHTFSYKSPNAGSDPDVHLCNDCFEDGPGSRLSFASLASVREEEYYNEPPMVGDKMVDIRRSYKQWKGIRNVGILVLVGLLWYFTIVPVALGAITGGVIVLFGALAWSMKDDYAGWLEE